MAFIRRYASIFSVAAAATCPDLELGERCLNQCDDVYIDCVTHCVLGDQTCVMECSRALGSCSAGCPCEAGCVNGCFGCENSICDGNRKSVLVLNTHKEPKTPQLIKDIGGVDERLVFSYGEGTEATNMCQVVFQGEMYLFGGSGGNNHISKIQNCALERIGDMPYSVGKACATFHYEEWETERVMFCFPGWNKKVCTSYDGEEFYDQTSQSVSYHEEIPLVVYDNKPMAMQGSKGRTAVELYDFETDSWTACPEYPYHDGMHQYATVTTPKGALIIGGKWGDGQTVSENGRYNGKWSRLTDLLGKRDYHSAVLNGNTIYILGGNGNFDTEIWTEVEDTFDRASYNVKLAKPKLNQYRSSVAFLVDNTFCVNSTKTDPGF